MMFGLNVYAENEIEQVTLTAGDHVVSFTGPTAMEGTVTRRTKLKVNPGTRARGEIPTSSGWAHENNSSDRSIDIEDCGGSTGSNNLTIGYHGSPIGDNGYNFVTVVEGTITYCSGGVGVGPPSVSTGESAANEFTLEIKQKDTIAIKPNPANVRVSSDSDPHWIKLTAYKYEWADTENTETEVIVNWSHVVDVEFSNSEGGEVMDESGVNEYKDKYIWAKSSVADEYTVQATTLGDSSEEIEEGTVIEGTLNVINAELDIRETGRPENRVCQDDTRIPLNARNKILVWCNSGANTVTFDLIKPPDINSPVWIQIEDQNGLNSGMPHFERLDNESGTFTYTVAQENDGADLIVRYGADSNGDNSLNGTDEIEGSYEVYGVTANEYAESRQNYRAYFVILHDMADQLHKRFRNGDFSAPSWPQGDFRPTRTTDTATLSANRFTHNFGTAFTAAGFDDIGGRKYFVATATLPIYFYADNSPSSKLIRESGKLKNGLDAFILSLDYATVSTEYAAAGGGATRSVTFSLDGAQFDFGATGWIGLGGVTVNSSNPYSSSGTITLQITLSGGNYEITADAEIDLTLHDVFDFNYFNTSWAADYSDASRSAGMIQSGFGRTGSTTDAGQVGLVEVEVDGDVETDERTVTP